MIDAENLSRLLGHLPPEVFRSFMVDTFAVVIPALEPKQGKREQRAGMAAILSSLGLHERRQIEEVAERIVLLSEGPGRDIVDGLGASIFDDADRAAFTKIGSQYERALWLHTHEQGLFEEALNSRQADVLRQSASCFSGFVATMDLDVVDDEPARAAFHAHAAERLGCPPEHVAVQIFKRLRPDADSAADVALYQISIHHNRPPEVVDCVQDSALVTQEVIIAISAHVTYEPANGHIEVLTRETDAREDLARLVADDLLRSPITGERVPLKAYSYQSLAAPRHFDISGESVAMVKVVELGYAVPEFRSVLVKIRFKDRDDIYAAARAAVDVGFDFRARTLNYAKIAVLTRKSPGEKARVINIVLRDDNKCNVKTKREKDRALCDRLLTRWGLVREIGGAPRAIDVEAA